MLVKNSIEHFVW